MGLTINIHACISICTDTGKPYYIGKNNVDDKYAKLYGIPDIEVPTEYRRFLNEKNNIYLEYLDLDRSYDDIINILDSFPTWNDIKLSYPNVENDWNWSEVDHNLFKKALEWFDDQEVRFIMVWDH